MHSLLCDYTADVPRPTLHEAIRALGDPAGTAPGHLCDTWCWPTLEGEPYAVSDLQAMLTTNGALLSVTADVKTSTGIQIITHYPAAMAQSFPLLAFAQTAHATSRELLLRWNPYFHRIHRNSFRSRLRQLLGLTEADQSPELRGHAIFEAGDGPHFLAVAAAAAVTMGGMAQKRWTGATGGDPGHAC